MRGMMRSDVGSMRFLSRTPATLAASALAVAAALLPEAALAGTGMPSPWQLNLQGAVTEVAAYIHWFHDWLNVIIFAITLFVLALLIYVCWRFSEKANPTPSKTTHNALLEVAWTVIPVLILVVIAIPSFRLLKLQLEVPPADITVKVTGKQWYWSYEYPQDGGAFTFDSLMLDEKQRAEAIAGNKIAAAEALASLAREDVPDEVAAAYQGSRPRYGKDYIIPVPFDPRLISAIPVAVARAAMESGVARKEIEDLGAYAHELSARRDPIAAATQRIYEHVRSHPKRVVFAEGEEEQVIRAAVSFVNQGLGHAILVGREERVFETATFLGIDLETKGISVQNARLSKRNTAYAQYLYERLQRQGYLFRDCQRLINQDRNHFAAAMVALGDADAMVTGVTRNYSIALEEVRRVIDEKPGHRVIGVSIVLSRERTVLVADTAITEMPTAKELSEIAIEAAGVARRLGYEPKVAMLAFSTFGHPAGERSEKVREAVKLLDAQRVDFEYDGEMAADVALNRDLMAQYPFCRLSGPANVLIMPAFHSASISTKMLQELGGSTVIGPLIVGLDKPVQIVPLGAKDSDIVNMAALAAFNIGG